MEKLEVSVGDRVTVKTRGERAGTDIVERITPTGIIRTKKSGSYRPDGSLRTDDPWVWGSINLITQEDLDFFEKIRISKLLYETRWMNLSLEILREIKTILSSEK